MNKCDYCRQHKNEFVGTGEDIPKLLRGLCTDCYEYGTRHVIYFHRNPAGEVFYVGSGSEHRAREKTPRSKEWRKAAAKGFDVEIVAKGLDRVSAYEQEEELIKQMFQDGQPLVNKLLTTRRNQPTGYTFKAYLIDKFFDDDAEKFLKYLISNQNYIDLEKEMERYKIAKAMNLAPFVNRVSI